MTDATTLIIHAGMGKTGTSSIQKTLQKARGPLQDQNVVYLGRMLQHCDTTRPYDWQSKFATPAMFYEMQDRQLADEIYTVLDEELRRLSGIGARLAIWSNETLFERDAAVGMALERLRADGVPLRILIYLRRPDKWARSAYAQWGIRHKVNEGPVKPFAQWAEDWPLDFSDQLERWNSAFGEALEAVNYDAVDDVSADFLERLDISDIPAQRVYETPPSSILAAWAVFNSMEPDQKLPDEFRPFLRASQIQSKIIDDLPGLAEFFPTEAQLADVLNDQKGDIARVNTILAEKGQPAFDVSDPARPGATPTEWEMIQLLLATVFSLQDQILQLRERVSDLSD